MGCQSGLCWKAAWQYWVLGWAVKEVGRSEMERVNRGPWKVLELRLLLWGSSVIWLQQLLECPEQLLDALHKKLLGFPGGAVVESLPANAGDAGSSPGLGRSHMPWSNSAREPQLLSLRVWSLWATITEPARLEPVLSNKGPRWWEARAPRWRVAPACHN